MTVTLKRLNAMTAESDKAMMDDAFGKVTAILVDRGFDIKVGNKDLGLVTTEYKQVGSVAGSPPFDFYLQVKATLKNTAANKLSVKLTPVVKEVNRLNPAAFTEHGLPLIGDNQKPATDAEKVNFAAQTAFMAVAQGVAEALGMSLQEMQQDVETSTKQSCLGM
jgi:hypothetical protein